jgi:nucleoside-diphosphate kinase
LTEKIMANEATEWTLCIIKPDAVSRKHQAQILQRIIDEEFEILALRQEQLSRPVVEGFYAVHRERPFFGELVEYMARGPVVLAALRRRDAVAHWRKVIGATDPRKADAGTLRKQFGTDISSNAVHGSDSAENGLRETAYFFPGSDLGR